MALLQAPQARAACKTGLSSSRVRAVPVHCSLRLFSKFGPAYNKPTYNKYAIKRLPSLSTTLSPSTGPEVAQKVYTDSKGRVVFQGVHHVALLVSNLERAMEFYQGVLGLYVNPDRPHDRLPYRGAWLWIGPEMIHLMELPNPDPLDGRPEHGGRDRHFCIAAQSVEPLAQKLDAAGVQYTRSMSGRPAIFFRDPDMNCLEVVETDPWR